MMTRLLYMLSLLAPVLLTACVSEQFPTRKVGKGTLMLSSINRVQAKGTTIATRAVDNDLAVEILNEDGTLYGGMSYAAGTEVPPKFILPVGNYFLHAYSENQNTWSSENGGLGAPVYDVRQPFTIESDWITYLDVSVPMLNYGVTYSVPTNFDAWFPTADFTVTVASRSLQPTTEQVVYFDPDDGDFAFSLHLVNSDGEEYTTETHTFAAPAAGHLYDVHYSFVSDDDPSRLRITITYEDFEEVIDTEIILD